MVLITKLIAIVIIIYGCLLVMRPGLLKQLVEYAEKGKRFYIISGVKSILGVIMILAANNCSIPWVVLFFGALSLLGGVLVFVFQKNFIDAYIKKMDSLTEKQISVIGVVAVAVGALLALAA